MLPANDARRGIASPAMRRYFDLLRQYHGALDQDWESRTVALLRLGEEMNLLWGRMDKAERQKCQDYADYLYQKRITP